MILTFILGVLAGWGAPLVEPQLRAPLQQALSGEMSPVELRGASVAICLLGAAILSWILASSAAVPLMLGGVIGVLASRMLDRFRAMRAPDYDS